jgi:hypothetical protein
MKQEKIVSGGYVLDYDEHCKVLIIIANSGLEESKILVVLVLILYMMFWCYALAPFPN